MTTFGRLTPEMMEAIVPIVAGSLTFDLGCGPRLGHTRQLLHLGARRVVAVDKTELAIARDFPEGATYLRTLFEDAEERVLEQTTRGVDEDMNPVAFVSFPQVRASGLGELVRWFDHIIYLGNNFSGTVCGGRDFWGEVSSREVLDVVESSAATLIAYGPRRRPKICRAPREELAARNNLAGGPIVPFHRRHELFPEGWL